jgi:dTDP-4-amino-4,6-dideoxygalactose transaminase
MNRIPVMKPMLPRFEHIETYLRRIDECRIYTNFGPLNDELTARLAASFNVDFDNVLLVSNGTLALQGAVVTASRRGASWSVPSWTFIATVQAILSAGCKVNLEDVSSSTWRLESDENRRADGVMTVVPFGGGVDLSLWAQESRRQPVVVDAASCFDTCKDLSLVNSYNIAVMVSLHATKLVTTGEGGVLVGPKAWIADVKKWTNFGFYGDRIARRVGTNAKLSEYNAAIGLACLDHWPTTQRVWVDRLTKLKDLCRETDITLQPGLQENTATSTVVALTKDPDSKVNLHQRLLRAGIESRDWWGSGVHNMPAMREVIDEVPHLPITDDLASRTLGLPMFIDIADEDLERLAQCLV